MSCDVAPPVHEALTRRCGSASRNIWKLGHYSGQMSLSYIWEHLDHQLCSNLALLLAESPDYSCNIRENVYVYDQLSVDLRLIT